MMTKTLLFIFCLMVPLVQAGAVEVAPRISDREIIESLADLKAGQKALQQQMDVRFSAINQRFKGIDQRFKTMDQRFKTMDQTIDQRFDDVNRRIGDLHNLMLAILAAVFGLIGFIVWDRRTMIRPLEQRFAVLETKIDAQEEALQRDLDLQSPDGSKIARILNSLRELARTDPKVATVLKQFSLM